MDNNEKDDIDKFYIIPTKYKGSGFFAPKVEEEQCPLFIDEAEEGLTEKYTKLDQLFATFFNDNTLAQAKEESQEERKEKNIVDPSFIYGEVTFRSMAYIIEFIVRTKKLIKGNFYDLGSGTGRGILSAVLCRSFPKYVGIEFIDCLYKKSLEFKNKFSNNFNAYYKQYGEYFPTDQDDEEEGESEEEEGEESSDSLEEVRCPKIEFYKNDFLKHPIKDASLILINSTCFTSDLMFALAHKCNAECRPGCVVVTFTKRLPCLNKTWDTRIGFKRLMSWGIATVYVHQKLPKK
jgi:hypothetical protein